MDLIDCHIHSDCSDDGRDSMLDMARASYYAGVRSLCFTDHVDLDDYRTGLPDPNCFSQRERLRTAYREAITSVPLDISVRLGVELGEGNHDPARAKAIAAAPEFDFVLGSLHNVSGLPDFYCLDYNSEDECKKLFELYVSELLVLSKLDFYDSMAHIGYPVRYARRAGFHSAAINMSSFGDELTALLKNLIEGGRGIEVNTAGYRDERIAGPIPSPDILRRYRDLGGEIVTIGSDAHMVSHAAGGIRPGLQLLQRLGFSYVTFFENRRPRFIKL
mgnify:CR=1 FL=1|jgi:histidinol-phosphatase (PHP family)